MCTARAYAAAPFSAKCIVWQCVVYMLCATPHHVVLCALLLLCLVPAVCGLPALCLTPPVCGGPAVSGRTAPLLHGAAALPRTPVLKAAMCACPPPLLHGAAALACTPLFIVAVSGRTAPLLHGAAALTCTPVFRAAVSGRTAPLLHCAAALTCTPAFRAAVCNAKGSEASPGRHDRRILTPTQQPAALCRNAAAQMQLHLRTCSEGRHAQLLPPPVAFRFLSAATHGSRPSSAPQRAASTATRRKPVNFHAHFQMLHAAEAEEKKRVLAQVGPSTCRSRFLKGQGLLSIHPG